MEEGRTSRRGQAGVAGVTTLETGSLQSATRDRMASVSEDLLERARETSSSEKGGPSPLKIESLDHIHIYAADPEESARFYQLHFEAKPVHRNANTNGDLRIFLALGGQILVIGSFPVGLAPASPPEAGDGAFSHGFGVAHFGLRVADVDAAIAELSASEVHILSQPVQEPSGLSYAYIAAPDGVVVELTQYEAPA